MTERPQNLRPARTTERTQNSNRYQYAAGPTESPTASYRGSHRVERPHWADDQRSSRVGRHHDAAVRDHSGRW
jgi:hypothetical protein